jgi:hypothetical protein
LGDRLVVNSACKNFIHEITHYIKGEDGKIPKKNDHLIDTLRYINAAIGYTFQGREAPQNPFKDYRGVRPDQDLSLDDVFDVGDFDEYI